MRTFDPRKSPVAMIRATDDDRITWCNPAAEQALDATTQQLDGYALKELLGDDLLAQVIEAPRLRPWCRGALRLPGGGTLTAWLALTGTPRGAWLHVFVAGAAPAG